MTSTLTAPRRSAAVRAPARPPRPAPRPARPDLRVVAPPRRQERGGLRWVMGLAFLVFVALFVAAWAHGLLVSGQARIDHLGEQVDGERVHLERERLALAELQSPDRIAEEARALGMVPAEEQTWISPGTGAEPVTVRSTTVAEATESPDATTASADDEATTSDDEATTTDDEATTTDDVTAPTAGGEVR